MPWILKTCTVIMKFSIIIFSGVIVKKNGNCNVFVVLVSNIKNPNQRSLSEPYIHGLHLYDSFFWNYIGYGVDDVLLCCFRIKHIISIYKRKKKKSDWVETYESSETNQDISYRSNSLSCIGLYCFCDGLQTTRMRKKT